METDVELEDVLEPIAEWARSRPDILGLGLVGSWARQAPRCDSDVDLILLVTEPQKFRHDGVWLDDIRWPDGCVAGWSDADYGAAWSRHVDLAKRGQVEFTFCLPSWAATDPVDAGTASVVSNGCRILVDKADWLGKLLKAVSP